MGDVRPAKRGKKALALAKLGRFGGFASMLRPYGRLPDLSSPASLAGVAACGGSRRCPVRPGERTGTGGASPTHAAALRVRRRRAGVGPRAVPPDQRGRVHDAAVDRVLPRGAFPRCAAVGHRRRTGRRVDPRLAGRPSADSPGRSATSGDAPRLAGRATQGCGFRAARRHAPGALALSLGSHGERECIRGGAVAGAAGGAGRDVCGTPTRRRAATAVRRSEAGQNGAAAGRRARRVRRRPRDHQGRAWTYSRSSGALRQAGEDRTGACSRETCITIPRSARWTGCPSASSTRSRRRLPGNPWRPS